jgi:hypothetical protein
MQVTAAVHRSIDWRPHNPPDVSDADLSKLYLWIARHNRIPDVADLLDTSFDRNSLGAALSFLERLRVVRRTGDGMVAVSPDVAEAQIIGPIQSALVDFRRRAEEVRSQFAHLRPSYFRARRERFHHEAIDKVQGTEELDALVGLLADQAVSEITVSQPFTASNEIDDAYPYLDQPLGERGIRLRRIFPHSVLGSPATQQHLHQMTGYGTDLRTLPEVLDPMIVVDGEVAVLPDGSGGATVVREPAIVGFLRRTWEHQWVVAQPFALGRTGYGDTFDEIKLLILRLLAGGLKDEAIAKRVNLSVRTCRRHIAEIMEEMRATSRFQAGAMARAAGMLDDAA